MVLVNLEPTLKHLLDNYTNRDFHYLLYYPG